MDKQQQIDAIKLGLAALDAAIAQTEAALRTTSDPDEVRSLTSALVDLRAERSRLQAQLNNLEAALVEVAMPAAAARRGAAPRAAAAPAKPSMVAATLSFARHVHEHAQTLGTTGAEPPARRGGSRPGRAPAPKVRRRR